VKVSTQVRAYVLAQAAFDVLHSLEEDVSQATLEDDLTSQQVDKYVAALCVLTGLKDSLEQ